MKDLQRLLEKADIQLLEPAEARARYLAFRLKHGWVAAAPILTDDTANYKLAKSAARGVRTLGLSLAHAKTSGKYNVCRYATPVCSKSCVADAGNGNYLKVKKARVLKTLFLAEDPSAFITLIVSEIDGFLKRHDKVAVRLNTFSDIMWEKIYPDLFARWGDKATFYDYSKIPHDVRPSYPGYDITRSASERTTDAEIVNMVKSGERVAVCLDVRKKDDIPKTYLGLPCVDGDQSDARFLDPKGVVVVLRPKGSARINGFARPLEG